MFDNVTEPPVTHDIQAYLHCGKCLHDKPASVSPESQQQIEVGWTTRGLQVWCKRHNVNVIHIDFHGEPHLSTSRYVEAPA